MATSRAWTYVAFVAIATSAVILADAKLQSRPSEQLATQRIFDSDTRQQDTIKTNPIYSSDSGKSTFGLDPARVVDW